MPRGAQITRFGEPTIKPAAAQPDNPIAIAGSYAVEEAIDLFLAALTRGEILSRRTGKRYAPSYVEVARSNVKLGQFGAWRRMATVVTLRDLPPRRLEEFLVAVRPMVDTETFKKIQQQVRLFARWLVEGPLAADPGYAALAVVAPPTEQTLRRDGMPRVADNPALTLAQAEKLFATAALQERESLIARKVTGATTAPSRNRLLVKLLALTGVRPSELAHIRIPNVTLDLLPRIHIDGTKTAAAVRDIPLNLGNRGLPRDLREYLLWRTAQPSDGHDVLFLSQRSDDEAYREGAPITENAIKMVLQRLSKASSIRCNALHLRHTFCTWCVSEGVAEQELATWMGHSDTSKISIYYLRKGNLAAIEKANRITF